MNKDDDNGNVTHLTASTPSLLSLYMLDPLTRGI